VVLLWLQLLSWRRRGPLPQRLVGWGRGATKQGDSEQMWHKHSEKGKKAGVGAVRSILLGFGQARTRRGSDRLSIMRGIKGSTVSQLKSNFLLPLINSST
jgi:hypothetical protein